MKLAAVSLLTGLTLTFLYSFKLTKQQTNHSNADAALVDGLYIFCDSKPIMPYDSIGTIELGFVSGTQYQTIRDNLIKRSKKQYQKADGLILHLNKKGVDHCTVIKFKSE
jgi:hypothetical protein